MDEELKKSLIDQVKFNMKKGDVMEDSILNADATAINLRGEEQFQDGNVDEAKKLFQDAITADPDNCRAHNNLGVLYWSLGDIEHSMEYFTKAYEINPYHRKVVLNLLEVLTGLNQIEEALLIGNTYLDQYPEDEDVSKLIATFENKPNQV